MRLGETAGVAYAALYDAPESVTAQLGIVVRRLEELARIDESVKEILGALQPATIAVEEAAHALRHYLGKLEPDPRRLDEVETRLAALDKLRRKYGATVEEVVAFLENVRRQLALVENSSQRRDALRKETEVISLAYQTVAG